MTRACYTVKWNEMSVKNQKMLITVMERAKKPIALNAGGIFPLNLSTLMTVCRYLFILDGFGLNL